MSASLRPLESQHTRPPCPSPTPGVHSDSRPSSQLCHPTISSSVVPFSSCPQSLPASERSEEHTSELQSLLNLVCRFLLEKKKHSNQIQRATRREFRQAIQRKCM